MQKYCYTRRGYGKLRNIIRDDAIIVNCRPVNVLESVKIMRTDVDGLWLEQKKKKNQLFRGRLTVQ